MADDKRITRQTEEILALMARNPTGEWAGSEITLACELKSGTVYPALIRMHGYGWLNWRWEDISPAEAKRPRKRFYKLTAAGEQVARGLALEAPQREMRRQYRKRFKPIPGFQS
jgi:PadR family transcriptional regulator